MNVLVCVVPCSDYGMNITDVTDPIQSASMKGGVVRALWQLALALVFKSIITIFTFGIKVRHRLCFNRLQ